MCVGLRCWTLSILSSSSVMFRVFFMSQSDTFSQEFSLCRRPLLCFSVFGSILYACVYSSTSGVLTRQLLLLSWLISKLKESTSLIPGFFHTMYLITFTGIWFQSSVQDDVFQSVLSPSNKANKAAFGKKKKNDLGTLKSSNKIIIKSIKNCDKWPY